jgi:hypothetical protein
VLPQIAYGISCICTKMSIYRILRAGERGYDSSLRQWDRRDRLAGGICKRIAAIHIQTGSVSYHNSPKLDGVLLR